MTADPATIGSSRSTSAARRLMRTSMAQRASIRLAVAKAKVVAVPWTACQFWVCFGSLPCWLLREHVTDCVRSLPRQA